MLKKGDFVPKFERILNRRFSEPDLNGEALAGELGMSRMHLHRHLIRFYEQPASAVIIARRMKRGEHFLEYSLLYIREVSLKVGYEDPAYFSRLFRQTYGESPSEYRRRKRKPKGMKPK